MGYGEQQRLFQLSQLLQFGHPYRLLGIQAGVFNGGSRLIGDSTQQIDVSSGVVAVGLINDN